MCLYLPKFVIKSDYQQKRGVEGSLQFLVKIVEKKFDGLTFETEKVKTTVNIFIAILQF